MSKLLDILRESADPNPSKIAKVLGISIEEVEAQLEGLRSEGALLGWVPLIHPSKQESDLVRAVIEVKISPEREGGFDRMALRISKFEEVESCYLMSGGYDLLVFVNGKNLKSVASFISERLATIQGVLSTATHFLLRPYKDHGQLLSEESEFQEKPSVSP